MKLTLPVASALAAAFVLASPAPAHACGGCFHQPNETTQVSGHRMILSVSQAQTTLWDQIQYVGNPTDFAWILPIRGTVTVGLSSDGLFEQLDRQTDEQVIAPAPPSCPGSFCNGTGSAAAGGFGSSTASGTGAGGGVNVISQKVVGPYETAQLQSSNPNALNDWLTSHGYVIPPAIQPVLGAYVAEGFDFLALRLLPGANVSAMRPVRVTGPGAGLSLPLRMVQAGTGATTPIKLWVLGQGRYEPTNMPTFTLDPTQLSWDFATSSSNIASLREAGFAASNHQAWLIESALSVGPSNFQTLLDNALIDPVGSGYGDDTMGANAATHAAEDVQALVGNLGSTAFMTRLDGELSRAALTNDLTVGASASQAILTPIYSPAKVLNEPTCPAVSPCDPSGGYTSGSGGSGSGVTGSGGSCSIGGGTGLPAVALGALGLLFATRRRRRSAA